MNKFVTMLNAIDKTDGKIKTFFGQEIIANDWNEAEEIVKNNFPYLTIHGQKVCEIDELTGKVDNFQLN